MRKKTTVKQWMWNCNMGICVGQQLWVIAIKKRVPVEKILARLDRHGIKMTPKTLSDIMYGRSHNINRLSQVALALGYTFSEVVQQAEAISSPAEIKKGLTELLRLAQTRQRKK